MKKKLFSILLSLAMVITMMPAMTMMTFANDEITQLNFVIQAGSVGTDVSVASADATDYMVDYDEVTTTGGETVATTCPGETYKYILYCLTLDGNKPNFSDTSKLYVNGNEITNFLIEDQSDSKKISFDYSLPLESTWSKLSRAMFGENQDSVPTKFEVDDTTNPDTRIITLLDDIKANASEDSTEAALVIPSGEAVVLDLNGFILDRGLINPNGEGIYKRNGSVIEVIGGNLTIKDSNTGNRSHKFKTIEAEIFGYSNTFTAQLFVPDNNGDKVITGGAIIGGTGTCIVNKDYKNSVNEYYNSTLGPADSQGGGIFVYDAKCTLESGSIVGNVATNYGGGVCCLESTFEMEDSLISGNYSNSDSGGICIHGGYIDYEDENEVASAKEKNKLYIKGGRIEENFTQYCAGGVGIYFGAYCKMTNGCINENSFVNEGGYNQGGGIDLYFGSQFDMLGGEISGNKNDYEECEGGGIYCGGLSEFNMSGGDIINNSVNGYGGGVRCYDAEVNFTGGNILNNTGSIGGAVTNNEGKVFFNAAENKQIKITGNTSTIAYAVANWSEEDTEMHLSGKVIIKDNICTGKYGDNEEFSYPINLGTVEPIFIDDKLTGSEIFITYANVDEPCDEHNTGVLTTGYTTKNSGASLNDFFHYDGPSIYYMDLNTDGDYTGELEIKAVPDSKYAISIPSIPNGKVTADKQIATAGETVTLTVTPAEGYELDTLTYTPSGDSAINISSTKSFTMPAKAVAVTATFKEKVEPTDTTVPVSLLRAYTGGKVGKKAVKLCWNKVSGATKYVVYGAKCGSKYKKIKTTSNTSYKVKKIGKKKLKAHKTYKFYVVAYNGNKKLVQSKSIHFITARTSGKYANIKSIKAKKSKLTLNVDAKTTVKATVKRYKGKKHLSKGHGNALKYTSNCPYVATVDSKGVVRAKHPGTATIYIQDIGGRYCKTVVTVK